MPLYKTLYINTLYNAGQFARTLVLQTVCGNDTMLNL